MNNLLKNISQKMYIVRDIGLEGNQGNASGITWSLTFSRNKKKEGGGGAGGLF